MPFSKTFPRTLKGSTYPIWEEVSISEQEEKEIEDIAKKENIELMKECIEKAREILKEKNMKDYQSDIVKISVSLFEKQASHNVYHKEKRAKERFDEKFKKDDS